MDEVPKSCNDANDDGTGTQCPLRRFHALLLEFVSPATPTKTRAGWRGSHSSIQSKRYSVLSTRYCLPAVVAALAAGPVALAIGVLEGLAVAGSGPTMLRFLVVVALRWAEAVVGGFVAHAVSMAILIASV